MAGSMIGCATRSPPASSRSTADGGKHGADRRARQDRRRHRQRIDLDIRLDFQFALFGRRLQQLAQPEAIGRQRQLQARQIGEAHRPWRQRIVFLMDNDGEPLGRSERQPRHMRQSGFDDRDTDQAAHDPVLQRAVRRFLDHELERGMARLHIEHGFGDAIDQEAMLIDRRQNPDGDAPRRRRRDRRRAGGEAAKARFDRLGNGAKRSPAGRRRQPVAVPFEQRAAERGFEPGSCSLRAG